MPARKRPAPRAKKPGLARQAPTPRGVKKKKSAPPVPREAASAGPALHLDPFQYARRLIRDIPDFPEPGIVFRDITPLLADPKGFHITLDAIAERFVGEHVDAIVAIESRGFIFGGALAARLNASFVPVRKPGKLPGSTDRITYTLEYGRDALEMHDDALKEGTRVVIVDDLLATGGTAHAAGQLVGRQGGVLVAYAFVIELSALEGRRRLEPDPVVSLLEY